MSIQTYQFGVTSKGEEVNSYKIMNQSGAYIEVLDFGGIIRSICVPDRDGNLHDVVLGYDTINSYETNPCYFGGIIGRNASRIAGGRFTIDGTKYQLAINELDYNLHSGPDGYEKRMWKANVVEEKNQVILSIVSKDMDQGFPGEFKISVCYEFTEDNSVIITYEGVSDKDTIANMTNHSYFNLGGHKRATILDTQLMIHADTYTVADSEGIPTGEIATVLDTPFDFSKPKTIGRDIEADFTPLTSRNGYELNYVLKGKNQGVREVAEAYCEETGIKMRISTDCVGALFYSGTNIGGPLGKENQKYGKNQAFCFETEFHPNAVNIPEFESPIIKKGEKYCSQTIYHFLNK